MKGLFIGINYLGTPYQLNGCFNDVDNMQQLYIKQFKLSNIRVLRDDIRTMMPTKANIISNLNWLLTNNEPRSQLFLHYSGHGSYILDQNGDEKDKRDETIISSDLLNISDDEIFDIVNKNINDSNLFAVFDSCHSGTGMDLEYNLDITNPMKVVKSGKKLNSTNSKVMFLSGCKDDQSSADAYDKINNKYQSTGALTWGLYTILSQSFDIDIKAFITDLQTKLKSRGYVQTPQLSFSYDADINSKIMSYNTNIPVIPTPQPLPIVKPQTMPYIKISGNMYLINVYFIKPITPPKPIKPIKKSIEQLNIVIPAKIIKVTKIIRT